MGSGFLSWNPLYVLAVATAPVVWLPPHCGYGGAVLLQLAVLAGLAAWLWRGMPNIPATRRPVPASFTLATFHSRAMDVYSMVNVQGRMLCG